MKSTMVIATAFALPLLLGACSPSDNQTPRTNEPGGSAPSSSFDGSSPGDTTSPNPAPQGSTSNPNPGDAATPGSEGATPGAPGTGDQGTGGQP